MKSYFQTVAYCVTYSNMIGLYYHAQSLTSNYRPNGRVTTITCMVHVEPSRQNFIGHVMYANMVIPPSVMNRCHHCDKPYSTSGIGAVTVTELSGGICTGCGKPAFADYVREELINLENTQSNSNAHEISMYIIFTSIPHIIS